MGLSPAAPLLGARQVGGVLAWGLPVTHGSRGAVPCSVRLAGRSRLGWDFCYTGFAFEAGVWLRLVSLLFSQPGIALVSTVLVTSALPRAT